MLRNLLTVAFRNFKNDKGYSLLNILGLTIGITFSLFLIFYIKEELSYDKYNKKSDRIYRVGAFIKEQGKPLMKWVSTQYPLGPTLKKDYPEVEEFTRFVFNGKTMYKNGDKRFYEEKIFFADSAVFKIFTHHFIEGEPNTALVAPNSMVLTKSSAEKYFGKNTSYVGKTLENDNGDVYKITAVINDVPKNSHLIFNALISITTLSKNFNAGNDNWG